MGWLIGLFCVLLIGLIPIGLRGVYDSAGGRVWLKITFFQFLIYPKRLKKKTPYRQAGKRHTKKKTAKKEQQNTGGNTTDFGPIVEFIFEILRDLWKKLQVDLLELKVVLAQEDPGDLAINYGRVWAALGNVIPQLERYCNIKKRDISVTCDFVAQQVYIFAQLQVSITLGRATFLLIRRGIRGLKNNIQTSNNRKGGAGA